MQIKTEITLQDIKEYFINKIYDTLPLRYPELNKNFAKLVFEEELKNQNFISGSLPSNIRAECAVFTIGGYIYNTTDELIKAKKREGKYHLLFEKIILAHRKAQHIDTDNVQEIDSRNMALDSIAAKDGIVFTEYEQALIESAASTAAGFWNG